MLSKKKGKKTRSQSLMGVCRSSRYLVRDLEKIGWCTCFHYNHMVNVWFLYTKIFWNIAIAEYHYRE